MVARIERIPVYAVIRYTRSAEALDFRVTVKEVLPTLEEAEAEVARLNELVADDAEVTYFAQPTRFFPEGRDVEVGY